LYTLDWVLCVPSSKFVTSLSQEALCLLLTSLLAVAVFLLYYILSYSFFEFSHSCIIFSLLLLVVLFGHLIFLDIFSCFVSLFFVNFRMLLISICFVSFPILSQYMFCFPLYCLSETSLFVCTAILSFHNLKVLFWKILLFKPA
jgi:hypothetical protein